MTTARDEALEEAANDLEIMMKGFKKQNDHGDRFVMNAVLMALGVAVMRIRALKEKPNG